ncbi:cell wall-binding repeat-containing protein [Herbiconiux solani]|uniref:cell wall-binding repeat-containing protein n=1 Tax=Herbiconiux solani TaxID=661329 RepID=UPI0008269D5E|nr:cell wall-binding repeat-containing protein [Herbiconiux solani]
MTRHIRSLAGAITFGALAALLTGTPAAHAAPPALGGIQSVDQTLVRSGEDGRGAERISGTDRYETANALAYEIFRDPVRTVFLASGETFPDALSGSVAAGAANAPVLLTQRDSISDNTLERISRMGADRVVILGGPSSVSPVVQNALLARGLTVDRIGGADRYEVSAAIAGATFNTAPVVFVASGELAADSLSAGAGAGKDSPVLLTQKDTVPQVVLDRIRALQPGRIVVVGGVNTVAETAVQQLNAVATVVRVSGADRYATSAAVADLAFSGQRGGTVYIASGQQFPDALTASAAAIRQDSPVLLVQDRAIPSSVAATLETLEPDRVIVLGGPLTISDDVVDQLSRYEVIRTR